MHHEFALLMNITLALVWAFAGGMLARRLGLPALVGYLAAGLVIGPFTPGFVGDISQINQLAEIGVIFLMFGVGLHFSLDDLWSVRKIAVPGALFQMTGAAFATFFLARSWGWSVNAALVLGLATSIASTVVLLRGLMDNGLLNSSHGRVAVGWLVLEDLATIAILVLLPPLFSTSNDNLLMSLGVPVIKAAGFVFLMLVAGRRFLPWLLVKIAFTRSRELFILAVVAVALGTAVASAKLFGVSLALGAFLAGVVLNRSEVSHQVGAEIASFRDTFTVLFFVSVGMLVNPHYLLDHIAEVLALTAVVVFGKAVLSLILGFFLPADPRTMIIVAAGLSQIGEFSFLVGQSGVSLGIISQDQYSLILAAAVISIMVNPFMFRSIHRVESLLRGWRVVWRLLERRVATPQPPSGLDNHVVVVGCGRVGEHIVSILRTIGITCLVVENDPERVAELNKSGIAVLFGDASNSEILDHASIGAARTVVVTLPDEAAAEIAVRSIRHISPSVPVVARGGTREGVERLATVGATTVIHPELEGGLEVMRHTLLFLGVPAVQVQEYTDTIRREHYEVNPVSTAEQKVLEQMVAAVRGLDVVWRKVTVSSPLAGKTLAEADLRRKAGLSVIAVIRKSETLSNPQPDTVIAGGDVLGLLGEKEQIAAADEMFFTAQKLL